jgi:hypothetical protein
MQFSAQKFPHQNILLQRGQIKCISKLFAVVIKVKTQNSKRFFCKDNFFMVMLLQLNCDDTYFVKPRQNFCLILSKLIADWEKGNMMNTAVVLCKRV